MQLRNTIALAMAALLVGSVVVGGTALASPESDVSQDNDQLTPDAYDLTVVDPDDRLTAEMADRAIELAWADEDVQGEFAESNSFDVTVQALAGSETVDVVIVGEDGEAAGITVDLDSGDTSEFVPGENIASTTHSESYEKTEIEADELETDEISLDAVNGTVDVSESAEAYDVHPTPQTDGGVIDVETASELAAPVDAFSDVEIEWIDEADLLTDAERDRLESLLLENDAVDEEIANLTAENGDAEQWTATVSEYTEDLFAPETDSVLAVDLSHDDTADAVTAFVDLDDGTVVNVVPVTTLDMTDSDSYDARITADSGDTIEMSG